MNEIETNLESKNKTPPDAEIVRRRNALVIGSRGAIGRALTSKLNSRYHVVGLHRENTSFTETGLAEKSEQLAVELDSLTPFSLIICTIGVLSSDAVMPEKKLSDLSASALSQYFHVNAVIPALCMQAFLPRLPRNGRSCYATLSAMVGSIGDNRLGGWYGYRASKSALNMIVRNAAIEMGRSHKEARIVAIHPGTTAGSLSAPFTRRRAPNTVFAPEITAERIITVCESIPMEQSGNLLHWSGEPLPF